MMTKALSQKEEYKQYLRSQEWKTLREMVMHRAKGCCEFCGAPAVDVHHVKYPKSGERDHVDHLVAICRGCHEKQHGIRVQNIPDRESSKTIEWSFSGKKQEYKFVFKLFNGKAWAKIKDVEKTLYYEDVNSSSSFDTSMNWHGTALEMKASVELPPEFRAIENGETWVRASGVFQLLANATSRAGKEFRVQLGDWLESSVTSGVQVDDAQSLSVQSRSASLAMLDQIDSVLLDVERNTAMIKSASQAMRIHESRLMEHDVRIDAIEEGQSVTQQLVKDAFEIGWDITSAILDDLAPDIANPDTAKDFGLFMAQKLKESGGRKTEKGWVKRNGEQVSRYVPWPGMVNKNLNKWKRDFAEKALPYFLQHKGSKTLIEVENTRKSAFRH